MTEPIVELLENRTFQVGDLNFDTFSKLQDYLDKLENEERIRKEKSQTERKMR